MSQRARSRPAPRARNIFGGCDTELHTKRCGSGRSRGGSIFGGDGSASVEQVHCLTGRNDALFDYNSIAPLVTVPSCTWVVSLLLPLLLLLLLTMICR